MLTDGVTQRETPPALGSACWSPSPVSEVPHEYSNTTQASDCQEHTPGEKTPQAGEQEDMGTPAGSAALKSKLTIRRHDYRSHLKDSFPNPSG